MDRFDKEAEAEGAALEAQGRGNGRFGPPPKEEGELPAVKKTLAKFVKQLFYAVGILRMPNGKRASALRVWARYASRPASKLRFATGPY